MLEPAPSLTFPHARRLVSYHRWGPGRGHRRGRPQCRWPGAGDGPLDESDAVAVALDDPDPWHGFVGYLETACAMQAADQGFADVLTTTFPTAKAMEERRNEAYEGMVRLIGRAKASGRLREDFDPSDLVLIHMANAGVVNATGDAAPDAWRRVVALFIQSFEAPARGPLPPSPEHDDLYRAMLRTGPTGLAEPAPGKTD